MTMIEIADKIRRLANRADVDLDDENRDRQCLLEDLIEELRDLSKEIAQDKRY